MDQDALNWIMGGRYIRLDARWNSLRQLLVRGLSSTFWCAIDAGRPTLGGDCARSGARDPWIVHYAGANKPWSPAEPKTPRDALWWRYAALSPMKTRIISSYRAKETKAQERRSKIPRALLEADA